MIDVMPPVTLRTARIGDDAGMAAVQNAIYSAGLRDSPVTTPQMTNIYLTNPNRISCVVATEGDRIIGFQVLSLARSGNEYGVPPGWGIVGTHIHPDVARQGVGGQLFELSLTAARRAGLRHIDAPIAAENRPALAYYQSLGFRPYREAEGRIPHRLDL